MRAAMEEAGSCPDVSVGAMAHAMARGSLMGARGNSGVILSQIFRGLASGLDGKKSFGGNDFAAALVESTSFAYKGMSKPVEGTILTVIREATDAAQARSVSDSRDLVEIMEAVVEESRASVARTPALLPVLRQAGVVDAGGQGLYVVFQGALRYLRGELEEAEIAPVEVAPSAVRSSEGEAQYGYCTEFLLQGADLEVEAIKEKLMTIGESVLVVGDESTVRAHVHTFDPGSALSYAASLGVMRQVKVDNMDDQHHDFIVRQPQPTPSAISTIAVASGAGLTQAFYSIGATVVVPGGETMNPSVQDLLEAVESTDSDKAIILPNNPNILLAAGQVPSLTQKQVAVVPTITIPQGIAALLLLNQDLDLELNVSTMEKALSTVRSGEFTKAVRAMDLDGLSIKRGQSIAFLDGELMAATDDMEQVVLDLLGRVEVEQGGLITLYCGMDTKEGEAEDLARLIAETYPGQEVEIVAGGQPHYNYIVSVE